MKIYLATILMLASCVDSSPAEPVLDAGPSVCKLDLDALCGARPNSDAYYTATAHLGTPEFNAADIEAIRSYGDRMTVWASCAATLAAEGR